MMMSYLVTIVVLCVIVSKHVIISDKNGTIFSRDDLIHYNNKDSLDNTPPSTLIKIEVFPDVSIIPTTYRSIRLSNSSSSTQERDTKLMNLLAARRSALHRDRFGTHRRVITTDKTRIPVEATSKSPVDFRTACVRNCTKNFTRRTTAGCMRKCTSVQRSIYSTTTINYASEEEKSQKDNNEILFTDESSHGFFVVAKDANDTINHIPSLRKVADISMESVNKKRSRDNAEPRINFTRKSPSLHPSLLRISSVSNEHPQVLEVSVAQRPFRSKSPNKFNVRDRSTLPLYRKLTTERTSILNERRVTATTQSTDLDEKHASNILKDIEDMSTSADVLNETESITSEKELISIENITPSSYKENAHSPKQATEAEASTHLLITVIESTETIPNSKLSTMENEATDDDWSTEMTKIDTSLHFTDDKTNLVIFVNKSTEIVTPPPSITTLIFPDNLKASDNIAVANTNIPSSVRSIIYPPNGEIVTLDPINATNKVLEQGIYHNNSSLILQKSNSFNENVLVPDMKRLNIAAYVLAGLGMFPILIVILYLGRTLILRRYKTHDEDFDVCITDQQPISPVKKKGKDDDEESAGNESCSISSIEEFDRANLRLKSLLGEGNFGQVWKAEADDLSGHIGATRIVAVKTVRSGGAQESLRDEAMIMRKLGSHPNVVTLLGACIESEPHMIIMEFAMRGRLLSLLRAARSATNILPASVPGGKSLAPLSPRTLAGFALDIATGMEYISDKKIVHRDLAARNVLIDHNGICKICDFGMSIDLDIRKNRENQFIENVKRSNSRKLDKLKFDFEELFINHWNHSFSIHNVRKQHDTLGRRPALPIRWMAPESLQYSKFSSKTDVWSFGIVLWEIATLGATPYSNLSGREVVRQVLQGTRPEIPKDGRHGFFNLMSKCWHKIPEMRPTFSEARLEISRFVCKWIDDEEISSDYMDVSGFSEDLEHGMVYFNQRISEFECEI